MRLSEISDAIGDLDAGAMAAAQERQDQLTKPPGSLGVLEQLSVKLAGMQGTDRPALGRKAVIVMAADHGVVEEGVSAFPSDVTAQMVANFIAGGAAVSVLAAHQGAEVVVVDMGVKSDVRGDGVINRKIRRATGNMADGPAMSREEAIAAVEAGAEVALSLIDSGVSIIATGDMGIGNTTASSAIVAVLGGLPVENVVGAGTGIDSDGMARKTEVIQRAIDVNNPDPGDPVDVLAKVGGFEIAGIAGVVLAAAARRVPVVIDGFISGAGALVAAKLAPKAVNYMIGSHLSVEPGHQKAIAEIGLTPMLHMDMRLGEGTGAVLALGLVEAAVRIINEMATFAEAGVATAGPDKAPEPAV